MPGAGGIARITVWRTRIAAGSPAWQQQATHHVHDLALVGVAVTDDRLLDLQGGVFGDLDAASDERRDRRATRLTEQQGRLRIDVHENDLDDRLSRLVLGDEFAQAGVDGSQAARQGRLGVSFDAAAGEVRQGVAGLLDDPKTGDAQSRIDSQNA